MPRCVRCVSTHFQTIISMCGWQNHKLLYKNRMGSNGTKEFLNGNFQSNGLNLRVIFRRNMVKVLRRENIFSWAKGNSCNVYALVALLAFMTCLWETKLYILCCKVFSKKYGLAQNKVGGWDSSINSQSSRWIQFISYDYDVLNLIYNSKRALILRSSHIKYVLISYSTLKSNPYTWHT